MPSSKSGAGSLISRIEKSASMNPQKNDGTFAAIALVGCLSALLQFSNKATLKSGTFLMNGYWASFYSMSYSDGFRRRAFIGSIIRALQPNGGSILAVNILAGVVLFFLIAIYAIYFILQSRKTNAWSYILCAAFFLSALISIFFEVFGDLLQIALLLFLVVAWFLGRYVRSGSIRAIIALCTLIPCFLIHEAAIFFIAPCIPFLLCSKPRLRHFLITAVALVIFLAWSTLWSHVNPRMTYHLVLLHGQQKIDTKEILGTPSFGQLMHQMYTVRFAGLRGKITFLTKFAKIFALILAAWIAAANIFPRHTLTKQVYLYMALMVSSIPFWILAADWGRFTAYYFLLAVTLPFWCAISTNEAEVAHHEDTSGPIDAMVLHLEWISQFTLVRITSLIALIGSPFIASRVYGMNLRNLLCVLFIGAFAVAQVSGAIQDPLHLDKPEAS
jgi:hypothetical protein